MTTMLSGTAFISGAAQGIGLQTAHSFAKHGIDRLALADANLVVLETAVEDLKAKYPRVEILALQVDVRNTSQVQEAFDKIIKLFGRLDIAVNNAGIEGPHVDTHTVDEKDWANLVEINMNGVWRCQREELRIMLNQEDLGLRQGRGRIVNVGSTWGVCAPPRDLPHTAYTAAKHGVVGLTKADAVAYGRSKIRLNAVCPGFTRTPLCDELLAQGENSPFSRAIEWSSLGRLAEPEEVTDCIAFLASPLSSFMQGAAVLVDGGTTLS